MVGWANAGHWPPRIGRVLVLAMIVAAGCQSAGPRVRRPDRTTVSPVEQKPADAAPAPRAASVSLAQAGSTRLIANLDGPLEVPTGQSLLLRLTVPAERVSIADPDVAEVVVVSPQQVLINGKGRKTTRTTSSVITGGSTTEEIVGEAQTSIIVWDRDGHHDVRTLYVNRARAEQILLEVTVADLNRTAMEQYGFDFQVLQGNVLVGGTPAKLYSPNNNQVLGNIIPGMAASSSTPDLKVTPDNLTYFVQDLRNNFLAFVQAMQDENLAKILARPSILARSGEEAHFRVGGEVPLVYATQNVSQITYKEFGTLLSVTPTLNDTGLIDLRIATEVSEPNFSSTVSVNGNVLPTFVSRRAETRVRLREEESLVIGGLYREDESEVESKVPYLGDIPYLGFLFRRTQFRRNKNELLILVKPRIARTGTEFAGGELPTERPPLTRGEVRTKSDPREVSRPRVWPPLGHEAPGPRDCPEGRPDCPSPNAEQ